MSETSIKNPKLTLDEFLSVLKNGKLSKNPPSPDELLSKGIEKVATDYLHQLDENCEVGKLYALVRQRIEPPLIKTVLRYTKFNRLDSAKRLGMSRTTFHKKLKQYNLDFWIEEERGKPLA